MSGDQGDRPIVVNRTELAGAFGVSLPTIGRWLERGCPCVERGTQGREWQFDLDQVRRWREGAIEQAEAEQAAKRQALEDLQASFDLAEHEDDGLGLSIKLRREFYEMDKKREERDLARGFLCRTADVRQVLNETFGFLSDRLQTLPDELERRCGLDNEAVDRMVDLINEWQAHLALEIKEWQPPGRRRDGALLPGGGNGKAPSE